MSCPPFLSPLHGCCVLLVPRLGCGERMCCLYICPFLSPSCSPSRKYHGVLSSCISTAFLTKRFDHDSRHYFRLFSQGNMQWFDLFSFLVFRTKPCKIDSSRGGFLQRIFFSCQPFVLCRNKKRKSSAKARRGTGVPSVTTGKISNHCAHCGG